MDKIKRLRIGAIILQDEKLVSMYRERDGRIYYTFPGGGAEEGESEEECVIREVYEEFGIEVKPIKKVYTYENDRAVEHFYVCEWVGGVFGTGQGEEYDVNQPYGIYKPVLIDVSEIPSLPLMPPEVAAEFYKDYISNGKQIRPDVKLLYPISK